MLGRTHLQDATPVTLGQVISGWVAQLDDAIAVTCATRARGSTRWRSAERRSAPGINAPAAFGEAVAAAHRRGHRQAVRLGAEQVRRAVGARRDGQRERRAAHAGRHPDEDRQRRALVRERAARGLRRNHDSRQRAGLVDHAGQDQPDAVRGADDGRRAGVRQRRRGRVRRVAGQLPAQRLQAGHPAQRAGVDRAPRGCDALVRRALRARASSPSASTSARMSRNR